MSVAASLKPAPSDPAALPRRPRSLQLGGLTPFTTIDYPGLLSAVLFVQGCAWRCRYCHNPHLQPRAGPAALDWAEITAWLRQRQGLLDAVVFSGGEPTLDPALHDAMAEVRALGFKVGLHTAGLAPRRLQDLLPLLDWVGLDIKAPLSNDDSHAFIVGRHGGVAPVARSLALLQQSAAAGNLSLECRTTAHPALLPETELLALARDLAAHGITDWVLQIARSTGVTAPLAPVALDYPSPGALVALRQTLPGFSLRRD